MEGRARNPARFDSLLWPGALAPQAAKHVPGLVLIGVAGVGLIVAAIIAVGVTFAMQDPFAGTPTIEKVLGMFFAAFLLASLVLGIPLGIMTEALLSAFYQSRFPAWSPIERARCRLLILCPISGAIPTVVLSALNLGGALCLPPAPGAPGLVDDLLRLLGFALLPLGYAAIFVFGLRRAWADIPRQMLATSDCPDCGYSLVGIPLGSPCPECAFDPTTRACETGGLSTRARSHQA